MLPSNIRSPVICKWPHPQCAHKHTEQTAVEWESCVCVFFFVNLLKVSYDNSALFEPREKSCKWTRKLETGNFICVCRARVSIGCLWNPHDRRGNKQIGWLKDGNRPIIPSYSVTVNKTTSVCRLFSDGNANLLVNTEKVAKRRSNILKGKRSLSCHCGGVKGQTLFKFDSFKR